MKACSFGDSNFVLRNVLLLLKERNLTNITLIERWIGQIIGPITIGVSHNADDDLYIRCQVTIDGMSKPIELVGTGYLQLIQIFCYVLLFEPGVLLIDEPDIHLHPHVQERLVEVLTQVARERDIKILLTTHSPFIVRGAPPGTNVTWLKDGNVESHNRQLVEMALGWGAFGKSIILVSEDSRNQLLKKLIAQWPELDRSVAFYPGAGYKNLPTPVQVKELIETLGGKFKVLIHRDRDSLTDDEVATLQGSYEAEGGKLWCTEQSDIEAYFCTPSYLKALLGCTESEAIGYVEKVLEKEAVTIQQQFQKQRAAHNEELHAAGGSLPNDQVWILMQSRPLKGAKGKTVFKSLKNVIPANAFSENSVQLSTLSGDLAIDLKNKLEQVIAAA